MMRLVGRRRSEAFAVHSWLQRSYGCDNPFAAALAHRLAVANSVDPFTSWSLERFTECLELLVEHRYIEAHTPPNQPKEYVIPITMAKRKKAKDTLPLAIEAVKAAASDRPATIKQIEASGHKSQMVRTAIDVLLAMGIVKLTGQQSTLQIIWDHRQEQLLKATADTTREYFQLLEESQELSTQVDVLTMKLQELDGNPASSPRPPPPEGHGPDE
jgi:hypothetical protein